MKRHEVRVGMRVTYADHWGQTNRDLTVYGEPSESEAVLVDDEGAWFFAALEDIYPLGESPFGGTQ